MTLEGTGKEKNTSWKLAELGAKNSTVEDFAQ